MKKVQELNTFKLPKNFRGRNAFIVQLWWLVQSLFFRNSPQFLYGFRRFLLRLFGAEIGKNFFKSVVQHLAGAIGVRYAFVG